MKTSNLILGFIILTALFTSLMFSGCQKEDDELMMEEAQVSLSDNSSMDNSSTSKKTFASAEISNNDIMFAKEGVTDECKHVDICLKNEKVRAVGVESAYSQLILGGMLFSCDPDVGLDLTEIITTLTPRIIANGGDFTSTADLKDEFLVWFYETYCPVDNDGENSDEGDGGTFEGDAGSNL